MHPSDDEEYRVVDELLQQLDHRPPAVDVRRVIGAARRDRWHVSRPIAAGIALCVVAAAASAAIPSSPVRRALVRVLASMVAGVHSTPIPNPPVDRDTARANAGTGIAIVAGTEIDVRFRAWQKQGQLTITFGDGPQLSLVPHGGDAAFSVSRGTIAVDNRRSGASFALEVPRTVQRIRVRIDTTTVFRKSAGTVIARALPDTAGGYTLDLAELSVPPPPRP